MKRQDDDSHEQAGGGEAKKQKIEISNQESCLVNNDSEVVLVSSEALAVSANTLSDLELTEDNVSEENKTALMLHEACHKGDTDLVRFLLVNCGADVDATRSDDVSGQTAIMIATARCNDDILNVLISARASVDWFDQNQETAMFKIQNEACLKTLLNAGANLVGLNDQQNCAFVEIVKRCPSENLLGCVSMLLKVTANPTCRDAQDGKSVLMLVLERCLDQEVEICELLLKSGANPSYKDAKGKCALSRAVSCGRVETVKLLISYGANPSFRDSIGTSLLMTVCRQLFNENNFEILKLLISAGAFMSAQDEAGKTALMYAIENQNIDCVQYLTSSGAGLSGLSCDTNSSELKSILSNACMAQTFNLNVPNLVFASENKLFGLIERMLRQPDFNINTQDSDGKTVLMRVCAMGSSHPQLVQILIEHGAQLSTQDKFGRTPMMLALLHCNYDVIKTLIAAGANVATQDNLGNNLLMMACMRGNLEIVKSLLENSAPASISNNAGQTAVKIAALKNHLDIVCVLLEHGVSVLEKIDHSSEVPENSVLSYVVENRFVSAVHPDFDRTLRTLIEYAVDFDGIAIVLETVRVFAAHVENKEFEPTVFNKFIREIIKKASEKLTPDSFLVPLQKNIYRILMDYDFEEPKFDLFQMITESKFKYFDFIERSHSTWVMCSFFHEHTILKDYIVYLDTVGHLLRGVFDYNDRNMNEEIFQFLIKTIEVLKVNDYDFKLCDPRILSPLSIVLGFSNWGDCSVIKDYVLKLCNILIDLGVEKSQRTLQFESDKLQVLSNQLQLPDSLWLAFQSGYSSVLPVLAPYWRGPPLALMMFLPQMDAYTPLTFDRQFDLGNLCCGLDKALDVLTELCGPLPPGNEFIRPIQDYLDALQDHYPPAWKIARKFRKLHKGSVNPPILKNLCRYVMRGCAQSGNDLPQRLSSLVPFGLKKFVSLT